MMLNKPNKDTLCQILKHKTNKEVGELIGVSTRTVQRWRDSYGLSRDNVFTNGKRLSYFQKELLTGWMLGDGSIPFSKESQNNRFQFGQCLERQKYVNFVYDCLKPFSSNVNTSECFGRKRCRQSGSVSTDYHKVLFNVRMVTIRTSEFKLMRQQWYSEPFKGGSKKCVPDVTITWNSLAYWFADDGCNNPARKTIALCTHGFRVDEVDKLIGFIKRDLDLTGERKMQGSHPIITFGSSQYDMIMQELRDRLSHLPCLESKLREPESSEYYDKKYHYPVDGEIVERIWHEKELLLDNEAICQKYKVTLSQLRRILRRRSLETGKLIPRARKLNADQVKGIITAWNTGLYQKEISDKFNVSQTMISAIINRKNHKEVTEELYIREPDSVAYVSSHHMTKIT